MTAIPPNPALIQQGAVLFNFPIAQDAAFAIGGLLNYILGIASPVGTMLDSLLTPAQLWAELGSPLPYTWVLADGSSTISSVPNSPTYSVALSKYSQVTGNTVVPDCRGVMRRGKNNGRSDGHQNPAGDLPLGLLTLDTIASHFHTSIFDQETNTEWAQSGTNPGGTELFALLQGFPQSFIFPVPLQGPSTPFYTGQAGLQYTSGYVFTLNPFGNVTLGAIYVDTDDNPYTVSMTVVNSPTLTTTISSVSQPSPPGSGTLTLVSGTGDATLTYTSVTAVLGNFADTTAKNIVVNSYIRIN